MKHLQTKINYAFIVIIFLIFTVSVCVVTNHAEQIKNQNLINIQNEIAERVSEEIRNMLNAPHIINGYNDAFLQLNGMSDNSLRMLQNLFVKELELYPTANIIGVGLKNGEYREAQRLKNGTIRVGERGIQTEGSLNLWKIDNTMAKTELVQKIKGYQFSKRPWYRSTVSKGNTTWSNVYIYSSNHQSALSENHPFRTAKGSLQGVLTTSISLHGLNVFLSRIKISPHSKIIITEPSGPLVAASDSQPLITNERKRINGAEAQDGITHTTVKEYIKKGAGLFRLHPDNQWIRVKSFPFNGPHNLKWDVIIISPEADFIGNFNRLANRTYLILIILLFFSLFTAYLISKKIASPIKQLSEYIAAISFNSIPEWDVKIPPVIKAVSMELDSLSSNFTSMMRRLQSAFSDVEKSRKEYINLVENINSIIMKITPDGTITYCNSFGLSFYGYTANELVGSYVQDTVLNTGDSNHKNVIKKIFARDKEYWNGANVNITKSGRKVWILWSNRLNITDDGTKKELFSIGQDITARKEAEIELEHSLKEKSILLSEVHHRVKNNLQIIVSLINLQLNDVNNEAIIKALRIIKTRIHSMSLVHEMLYSSTSFSAINLTDYIRILAGDILQTFNTGNKLIDLKIVSDNVVLGIDQAITLGLIVNELISNAVKYAFPDKNQGRITIELTNLPVSKISVTVSDNGIGISQSNRQKSGLGTILIDALTDQLEASLEKIKGSGTIIRLIFQKKNNGWSQ